MAYEKKSFGGPRRKKTCPFTGDNAQKIDWKNVNMLGRYVSGSGKIAAARMNNIKPAKQRELTRAIKRARFMALMPFVREDA